MPQEALTSLPFLAHITILTGQAWLLRLQSRSRMEYLIPKIIL